ncbi:uncharacterized protein CPUR_05186 [Claviceps purpurea 20.1]|uniref:Protein kinase domain-containing protein n=1 Tax=Claviceps purpurea (strain 20.1) TaxID=1111077 RepID=M1W7V6_CLAP2|nr:hypothetical protein E4U37_007955 [Claviceps purpurea]CCE31335.1 uncharacterized protein CPUR_05186 [Claviceps purpurea 20.1]KAG6147743.1 hypothetical protein E4U28_006245 [Claviceps purpurea]KAG6164843.1 hypothetical protein E4U11_000884 [Claviceps purpurea]KAG6192367.1 hypothetical protein E4U10_004236 [Claviceps purpurea]
MEVNEFAEFFVPIDGEDEFYLTRIILRGPNEDFYYAETKDRFHTSSEIDIDSLEKISIDTDKCWPRYSARLLRAPSPVPPDSYVKEAEFLYYNIDTKATRLRNLAAHEIEAFELLRQHPHPNIVEYRGCVVSDGRISGICLAKLEMSLYERMQDSTPFDKDLFLEGIERGIRHLHSLGIVHNDINPATIMLDKLDRPVIIDLDTWQQNGQELDMKKGTPDWSINGSKYDYALFEKDIFGLSKIREFIYDPSSGEPLA